MGKQDNYLTLPDPKVKVATLQPHGLHSPWNSPGQNSGVDSLSLLQGIFPTQGSNPGLRHCRRILYQLSHKGSPRILEWVDYPFSRGSSRSRNRTQVSCIAGRFFTNWAIKEALFSDSYQGSSLLFYSNKIFKLLKNLRTVDYYVHESNITFHCDPGKFAALSLELTLFKFSQR